MCRKKAANVATFALLDIKKNKIKNADIKLIVLTLSKLI